MTRIKVRDVGGGAGLLGQTTIVRPPSLPEGSVVTVLRVPPELAGMRLDRFVQSELKRTSRTRTQVIIKRSAFSPDARPLRGSDRVRAEQCILLWRAPWDEKAAPTEIPILFEDEHILAVNKPPHVPVHPTARYHASTVVKLLEALRPDDHLRLSHRIDRETSGVLLMAKDGTADRRIKAQFEGRSRPGSAQPEKGTSVQKHYLAITWGWPEFDAFRIALPLELDTISRYKVKMRVAREGGMHAATGIEVLGRRVHAQSGRRYAMLRCHLETGRQHQIRVHLASQGMPIVGDKLYGPDEDLFARGVDGELTDADRELLELGRHALHAESLELDHPMTGDRLRILAELPADLRDFWESLREQTTST